MRRFLAKLLPGVPPNTHLLSSPMRCGNFTKASPGKYREAIPPTTIPKEIQKWRPRKGIPPQSVEKNGFFSTLFCTVTEQINRLSFQSNPCKKPTPLWRWLLSRAGNSTLPLSSPSSRMGFHGITAKNKIGTTKIAKLVDIFFHMSNPGFSSRTGMLVGEKSLQPQLSISPIAYDVIVLVENLTVSFAKGIGVPAVFMIEDHFI